MKRPSRKLLLSAILITAFQICFSQQNWSIFGNSYNSVFGPPIPFSSPSLTLGTTDDASVTFITNGVKRFTLFNNNWASFNTPVYFYDSGNFKDDITGYKGARLYNRLVVTNTATPSGTLIQIPNAAYFSGGNVIVNNDLLVYGTFFNTSDKNLKKDIKPLSSPLQTILDITPYTYSYDKDKNPGLALPSGIHYGVIAQEIQNILPNLVHECNVIPEDEKARQASNSVSKHLGVNYIELIPILIGAVKEQHVLIEKLSEEIKYLKENDEKRVAGNNNSPSSSIDQNIPNPANGYTTIKFMVPTTVIKSEIKFFNDNGIVQKLIENKSRGAGEINISVSEFQDGIYFYQLINDGKIIDTKKMVIYK